MTLRVLVCLYFLYLAWQIASGGAAGTSPIPQWGVVALTAAFAAVAVGFGYYAWRRYRTDLKAAELTEEERRGTGGRIVKSRSVREEAVRLVLLLAGLCVAHLGVTLFCRPTWAPILSTSLCRDCSGSCPGPGFMTHGRVHLLVSLVIMVVLLVVDRKFVRIGTVVCMALGGPIIDVFTVLLAPLIHSERPLRCG